jgi:DNA-binding NarL/FixJ family response regulator
MIRVSLIAPTPTLRAGLRAMLADRLDIEIVSEASAGDDLAFLLSDGAHADVLVLSSEADLHTLSIQVQAIQAQAMVVMSDDVVMAETVAARLRSMNLRAWGMAPSDATPDELYSAIVAVAQGLVVMPARFADQLIPPRSPETPSTEKIDLTPRESEVLELLSRGLPNKLIAQQLGISEPTAKFHVSAIYAKLGVASRAEAVSKAARAGLITL